MNGSGSGSSSSSLYRCIVVSLYRFLEVAPTGCDGLQIMAVLSVRQSTGWIPRSSFNNFFFTKS